LDGDSGSGDKLWLWLWPLLPFSVRSCCARLAALATACASRSSYSARTARTLLSSCARAREGLRLALEGGGVCPARMLA
jgi:hypothetical protein